MNILKYLAGSVSVKSDEDKKTSTSSKSGSVSAFDKLMKDIADYEAQSNIGIEKPKVADTPKLEKLEYNAPTDQEIEKIAGAENEAHKAAGINSINEDNERAEKEYQAKLASIEQAYEKSRRESEQAYELAKKELSNEILKRGLARSSIAVNAVSALGERQAEKTGELATDFNSRTADINAEIATLSGKLEKALNDFNISAAAKLSERISTLKNERDKKQAEVIEYNNKIAQQAVQMERDKAEVESGLLTDAYKQQEMQAELNKQKSEENYRNIYMMMDAYLSSLSDKEAKETIRNNNYFKSHLNDYYYYRLYNTYGR